MHTPICQLGLDRGSCSTLEGRVVCRLVLDAQQRHGMLVDPIWEIGGADLVGDPAPTSCTARKAAKCLQKPGQMVVCWGWSWGDLGIVKPDTDGGGLRQE